MEKEFEVPNAMPGASGGNAVPNGGPSTSTAAGGGVASGSYVQDHAESCPYYKWDVSHRQSLTTEEQVYDNIYKFELNKRGKTKVNLEQLKAEVNRRVKRQVVQDYLRIVRETYDEFGPKMLRMCTCVPRVASDALTESAPKGVPEQEVEVATSLKDDNRLEQELSLSDDDDVEMEEPPQSKPSDRKGNGTEVVGADSEQVSSTSTNVLAEKGDVNPPSTGNDGSDKQATRTSEKTTRSPDITSSSPGGTAMETDAEKENRENDKGDSSDGEISIHGSADGGQFELSLSETDSDSSDSD